MGKSISIYSDGGSRGNPGPAAFAFVVLEGEKIISKDSEYIGTTTNNVAEYMGAREAMKWIKKNEDKLEVSEINLFFDSQLLVKQLTGEYKIKSKNLIPLAKEIKQLEKEIDTKIYYNFIKRDKNEIADKLLNERLDQALGV